jgi:flagellar biosynthesis protein FliQ
MNEDSVLSVGVQAVQVLAYVAGPLLLIAMAVGILVSVFQAVTQINEATLTFIPKMIAVFLALILMGPWMLQIMKDYATEVFGNFHTWVR